MVKRIVALALMMSGLRAVAEEPVVSAELTAYEKESLEMVLTTDLPARLEKIEEDLHFWLEEQVRLMAVLQRSGPNDAVFAMLKMVMAQIDSLRAESEQLFDQLKTAQRLGSVYVASKN